MWAAPETVVTDVLVYWYIVCHRQLSCVWAT